MAKNLLTIKEAADYLEISIDTLRRWDKHGKLKPLPAEKGAHRRYEITRIEEYARSHSAELAKKWAGKKTGLAPNELFYCPDSYVFQGRLYKLKADLDRAKAAGDIVPLLLAITGEIGDNSFAHNLGNWPDVGGIFFAWDTVKRLIVLADRGLGVLATLKRVRPEIKNDAEALKIAFTEIVSGRAPESRGNGLKYVRNLTENNPIALYFQSGQAELTLKPYRKELFIKGSKVPIRGCLAIIKF